MENKLKKAMEAYESGHTCSQAVFMAYIDEMNMDKEVGYRIMEGFGGGCGGLQEVCGALSGAFAVVGYYFSDGEIEGGKSKKDTYKKIREVAEMFKNEYRGITCRDVLHGEKPKALQCRTKIKDTILILENILQEK